MPSEMAKELEMAEELERLRALVDAKDEQIAKLRAALNHVVHRTHVDTHGCDGCKDVWEALK